MKNKGRVTQNKKNSLKEEQRQKEYRKKRNLILSIGGIFLVGVLVVSVVLGTQTKGRNDGLAVSETKDAAQLIAEGQDLIIPVSEISETANYYPVTVDGTEMEVLAVKAPDGTIRTAFNTCQICYSSGRGYYKQEGDVLVCQNCGNRFKMSQVEIESGGCNPWPIFDDNKTVTSDTIAISYDFLNESKQIFANWKTSY